MFVKKTIVLTEEKRRASPLALTLTCAFDKCNASVLCNDATLILACENEIYVAKESQPPFSFNRMPDCDFSAMLIVGELCFFGFNGKPPFSREKLKKAYFDTISGNVKKAYDDEAIATENYYANPPTIYPTFGDLMCDKGHFFIDDNILHNQNSTIYPQCGYLDSEVKNDNNTCFPKEELGTENEADFDCKTEESKPAFGTEENGDCHACGGEFYTKIEPSLHSLFCSFPHETALERTIVGSTFVKINYAGDKFYVAGITEFEGKPEYVIFGIPLPSPIPPAELSGTGYFVPTEGKSGYYLLYQDAATGKIITP